MSGFFFLQIHASERAHTRGQGRTRGSPGNTLLILVAGAASAALYLITQITQRAIFRNGLRADLLLIDPGYPADSSALFWQYGLYVLSTLGLFALYRIRALPLPTRRLGPGSRQSVRLSTSSAL